MMARMHAGAFATPAKRHLHSPVVLISAPAVLISALDVLIQP